MVASDLALQQAGSLFIVPGHPEQPAPNKKSGVFHHQNDAGQRCSNSKHQRDGGHEHRRRYLWIMAHVDDGQNAEERRPGHDQGEHEPESNPHGGVAGDAEHDVGSQNS